MTVAKVSRCDGCKAQRECRHTGSRWLCRMCFVRVFHRDWED